MSHKNIIRTERDKIRKDLADPRCVLYHLIIDPGQLPHFLRNTDPRIYKRLILRSHFPVFHSCGSDL